MASGNFLKIKIRYESLTVLLILLSFFFFACSSKNQFDCEQIINPSYSDEIEKIEAYLDEKNLTAQYSFLKIKTFFLQKAMVPATEKIL